MDRCYVAFDLETTGVDPLVDEVIQVGAVRFAGGQVTAEWCTYADPGRRIPPRVARLTGIDNQTVAGCPSPVEALRSFAAFAGQATLVVHNAPFDLGFLFAAVPEYASQARVVDTLELARILLPAARSHRLAALARELGLAHQREHDALADARAATGLFLRLLDVLRGLDGPLLARLDRLLGPTGTCLGELVAEASFLAKAVARKEGDRTATRQRRPASSSVRRKGASRPFDPERLRRLFLPDGEIARVLPGYEFRQEQLEMLDWVCSSLSQGSHLLIEAGTGVGKSLAYLVPAVYWAVCQGEPVVISTHTINLQDQLWEKDIPLVRSAIPVAFEAALVKGRANYVCRRKAALFEAEAAGAGDKQMRAFAARQAVWLAQTQTGDRSELGGDGELEEFWGWLAADGETCLGPGCEGYIADCYVTAARRRAQPADIIVVNHSLLFSDVRAGGGLLPPYANLIVDEAHHLEDVATHHLTVEVSERAVAGFLDRLWRGEDEQAQGFLSLVESRVISRLSASDPTRARAADRVRRAASAVGRAREACGDAFACLVGLRQFCAPPEGEERPVTTLRLRPEWRTWDRWHHIDEAAGTLVRSLEEVAARLRELAQVLEGMAEGEKSAGEAAQDAVSLAQLAGILAVNVRAGLWEPDESRVCWAEFRSRGESGAWVNLRSSPVDVGPALQDILFSRLRCVIMTSATLATADGFSHFKQRVGLEGAGQDRLLEVRVGSPFVYKEQALVCLATDLPSPREVVEDVFARSAAAALVELVRATEGGMLVLFTSHRMLAEVSSLISGRLEEEGFPVLTQGFEGGRARLLDEFRSLPRAVLLATSSFWEGVDVPGEALRCVVMVRLPFWPPTLPVVEARLESLEKRGIPAFENYSLPQAVLRFRQGFGRLVRSRTDRGVVVVLDPRLVSARQRYGEKFLNALPGPSVVSGPVAYLVEEIAAWLGRNRADAGASC